MTTTEEFQQDIRLLQNSCRLLSSDKSVRGRIATVLHGLSAKFVALWFAGRMTPEVIGELRRQYEDILNFVEVHIAASELDGRFSRVKEEVVKLTTKERAPDAGSQLLEASQSLKAGIEALAVKYGDNRLQNA
jgi:hypothetical protein